MATKSPLAKALKGNQGKLPQALQDAIKAAPESPAKQTTSGGFYRGNSPVGNDDKFYVSGGPVGSDDKFYRGGKKSRMKKTKTAGQLTMKKTIQRMPETAVTGLKPKSASIPLSGGKAELAPVNKPTTTAAPKNKKEQRRNKRKATTAAYLELGAQRLKNVAKKYKK